VCDKSLGSLRYFDNVRVLQSLCTSIIISPEPEFLGFLNQDKKRDVSKIITSLDLICM
jgi:hypothetical protein